VLVVAFCSCGIVALRCDLGVQGIATEAQPASPSAADPPVTTFDTDKLPAEHLGQSTDIGTPAATVDAADIKPAAFDSGDARAIEREIQSEFDETMVGLAVDSDTALHSTAGVDTPSVDSASVSAPVEAVVHVPEAPASADQGAAVAADASVVHAADASAAPSASSAGAREDSNHGDLDIHLDDAVVDDTEMERLVDELSRDQEELKDDPVSDDIALLPPSNSELMEEVQRLQGEGRHSAAIAVLNRAVEQASALVAALGPDPSHQVSDKETKEARANATATLLEAHGFLGEIYLVRVAVCVFLLRAGRGVYVCKYLHLCCTSSSCA
jgi:hypothetical protein